ncbi:MAG TPA: SIS domain-containing protein [Ruminiclostridium sp.]
MKQQSESILEELIQRYPALTVCTKEIEECFMLLKHCYENGGKVLVCGNGGSAADAEHIVGELMKEFILKRPLQKEDQDKLKESCPNEWKYLVKNLQGALPAISLVSQSSISTAYSNDVAFDMVFAQQVYGYGKEGDVLIGLSTSGNSGNVVNAIKVAKAFGMKVIGFTGQAGGEMKEICDVCIQVPAMETFKVQEYHLPVYHAICAMIESEHFN